MKELAKIHDVSLKYDISTRALKYYEDMGLIKSTHIDDYSYRCYDEAAIMRLEQILILRRLDISIKDIGKIFASPKSDILLEILRGKVDEIEQQSDLLRELKNIVLDFINRIEQYNFEDQNDVRLLYETTAVRPSKQSEAPAESFMEITKKLEKSPVVSVKRLPAVKMAICYDDDRTRYDAFHKWIREVEEKTKPIFSPYLEWYNAFVGHVAALYPAGENCPFDTFDFPGGLYACATFLNDPYPFSMEINSGYLYKWIGENTDYELYLTEDDEDARFIMWRPIVSLGSEIPQEEYFIPIVRKGEWRTAIKTTDIPAESLYNPALVRRKIDLRSMRKSGDLSVSYRSDEAVLYQLGQEGALETKDSFHLPIRIDLTAKTDSGNIRLGYGSAGLVFNWGVIPTAMLTHDVIEGGHTPIYGAGYIPPNKYAEITWILTRDFNAVIIDGETRFYKDDFPYMERLKNGEELEVEFPVRVTTAFGAEVAVKKLDIWQKNID